MELFTSPPIKQDIPYLCLTRGLPASGKTTWAMQKAKEEAGKTVRVNRDDLRNMRGEYWIPKEEDMITKWEYDCIATALLMGKNVIVDATNLHTDNIDKLKIYLDNRIIKYKYVVKDFTDVSVAECIERDKNRMRTKGYVGEEVIIRMAKKAGLMPEQPAQRFLAGAKDCIICDIDGTLAHNKDRSFYDEGERLLEDTVDWAIAHIVTTYWKQGKEIFLFSGRKENGRDYTMQWLQKYGIPYHHLVMRAQDDNRKDSIVKREMYEKLIKGKYNVLFVLDDRDQVVKMWRHELGLKVLQVAEGNF